MHVQDYVCDPKTRCKGCAPLTESCRYKLVKKMKWNLIILMVWVGNPLLIGASKTTPCLSSKDIFRICSSGV